MGIVQTCLDNDIFTHLYKASLSQFPSFMKAEFMAIFLALCTAPDFCSLTIYTDS